MIRFSVYAQTNLTPVTDTLYFSKAWKKCAKEEAMYYRVMYKQDENYLLVNTYASSNRPQLIALSTTIDPPDKNGKGIFYFESGGISSKGNFTDDKEEGPWVFYSEDGNVSSKGSYKNAEPNGIWVFYDQDGKDSSVVDIAGKMYKNIYISSKSKSVNDQFNKFYPLSEEAKFPGEEENALGIFINKNIKYPQSEKKRRITGTSYVSFIIEKDGSISDIKVIKGIPNGEGCDQEAIRVVSMMPKWIPGKIYGTPVKVKLNLPIKFVL